MRRAFYKLHGIGNDYIYFDCRREGIDDPSALSRRLSNRHFSVGGDGVVLLLPSGIADIRMRMFNADGSEGSMCGNAVRCVAKLLRDVFGVKSDPLTVETNAGVKSVRALRQDGETLYIVEMGSPDLSPRNVPCLFEEKAVAVPLKVGDEELLVTCLSMGNPHCVVFCDLAHTDFERLAPKIETHPAFPDRVNAEFVSVVGKNELAMRVFERGSGETLACGTGACAAAVAAVENGYAEKGRPILVHLRGGDLTVLYAGESVFLTGPAELAFYGEIEL